MLYYGVMHPVACYQGLSVKPPFATNIKNVIIYNFITTCFSVSDGHPQVNRTKYSKKLLFLQWIRCV
jgi:hypothetical protein